MSGYAGEEVVIGGGNDNSASKAFTARFSRAGSTNGRKLPHRSRNAS